MALLRSPDVDLAVKREVPLILGQIRTSAARAALMIALFWPDPVVSFRALKVLNKTRAYRDLSYVEASFVPVLMQWARQYYQARNLESVIPREPDGSPADGRAWRLLLKLVRERQSWSVEKIFRTLDLFLPRGEGYLSYLAMGDRTLIRDNAIELIDLRLKGEAKQVLIPIFAERDPKEQAKIGRRLFGLPAEKIAVIHDALFDSDPLVRSSVLAVVGEEGLAELLEDVKKAGQDPNKLVRETAQSVLRNLSQVAG